MAPTADQDNHQRNWGDATDARTAVLATALTKASLLSAMRQRRVYATEDPNLRLNYTLNGQLLGARIIGASMPASGAALSLTLTITDDDEPAAAYTVEGPLGGNRSASERELLRRVRSSGKQRTGSRLHRSELRPLRQDVRRSLRE